MHTTIGGEAVIVTRLSRPLTPCITSDWQNSKIATQIEILRAGPISRYDCYLANVTHP
jgi:hypothetical protein